MTKLIALIDGSVYSQSVCDHAAWVSGRTGLSVELLHVLGRRDVSSEPANLSGSIGIARQVQPRPGGIAPKAVQSTVSRGNVRRYVHCSDVTIGGRR